MSDLKETDNKVLQEWKKRQDDVDKLIVKLQKTLYERLLKNVPEFQDAFAVLSEDRDKKFRDAISVLGSKKKEKDVTGLSEEVKQYEAYAKRYIGIAEQFSEKVENLENKKDRSLKQRRKDRLTVLIGETKNLASETLAGLDEKMAITDTGIISFVEGLVGQSRTQIIQALQVASEALKVEQGKAVSGSGTEEQNAEIAKLQARIVVLQDALRDASKGDNGTLPIEKKNITSTKDTAAKPEGKSNKATDQVKVWEKTGKLMGDAKKLTLDILDSFDGIDEGTKKIIGSAFSVAETTATLIASITGLSTASIVSTTAVAATSSATIQGLETASVILKVISAALMVAQALANLITGFITNDKSANKGIEEKQKQVDALKKSYEKLEEEIEGAYGYDAAGKIEEQNENLQAQQVLIKEQMSLENDKKKTDKGKMKGYQDQLDANEKQIKANEKAALDAVFGADLESAIDDFATAYLAVWDDAEGKVHAQQDVVKNMIKGIIKELIKSGVAEKVAKLRETIAEAMKTDGISESEKAVIEAQAQEITDQMDRDTAMMGEYLKEDDPEREASKKGFGAITQESANELNGKFTTIQEHTAQIKNSITTLILNSGGMLKHLAGIESNTSHCLRLESIQSDMNAVKTGIGIMTTKGVKML